MECPFELPVRKAKDNIGTYYIVENRNNENEIAFDLKKEQADYIVQAINSQEKLVEAINLILNENFSGKSTLSPYAKRQGKQALKEAEKK